MFEFVVRGIRFLLRYALAVLTATMAAAFALAVQLAVAGMTYAALMEPGVSGGILVVYLITLVAAPLVLLGITFLGLPTWAVAVRIGRTGYRAAAVAGAIETTVVGAAGLAAFGGMTWLVLLFALPVTGAVGGMCFRALVLEGV